MSAGMVEIQGSGPRTAIVTGGEKGIGAAIVNRLLRDGYRVASLDITPLDARRDREGVLQLHGNVAEEGEVRQGVETALRSFGRLDLLVNNAGVNAYFDAEAMSSADWDRFMAVDLKGAWLCCKYALPYLRQTRGVIVNISSIHARQTVRGFFPYSAAKAGLVGLTKSLALDYGKEGVRAVAVSPGWIRTELVADALSRKPHPEAFEAAVLDLQPIGRMGQPSDVASLVAFLASEEAGFITGCEIAIDGGLGALQAGPSST